MESEVGGTSRSIPKTADPSSRVPREVVGTTVWAHGYAARMRVTEGRPATVKDPDLAGAFVFAAAASREPESGA